MHYEISSLSARSLAAAIQSRKISANEALEVHFAQIDVTGPAINAIVTQNRDAARRAASVADALTMSGAALPPLHGVPMTHKDTHNTQGIRTTQGSVVFKDYVPDFDDLIIHRLKKAGVVTTGKSNVPEFAAGSHTFNELFGTTTNPYATSRSAGGSSGGAAAAIAARIQSIGDGSDMGGSLRIPASFCNISGFRPSAGVVPMLPSKDVFSWLGRVGPLAREISDIALVMSVIAGSHPHSPITNPVPPERFTEPLERDLTGLRIGYSPDFGIGVPVEPEVLRTLEKQLDVFEHLGAKVEQAAPDLREADMVFGNVRAMEYALKLGDVVREHCTLVKPEVRWNVEKGWALTSEDWVETTLARSRLEMHVQTFFGQYDIFASPSAQTLPFDASLRFPTRIAGSELDNYLDWMRSACLISATGLPALSVPSGFSDSGLPVGMQLVMNHGADFELLQVGYAFEQATRFAWQAPAISNS